MTQSALEKGISEVEASHINGVVFDDLNLVSAAGLWSVLKLAEVAGLHQLLARRLRVASPNPAVSSACVVAGMLAGADSIEDLDLLRHGGAPPLRWHPGALDAGDLPALIHPRIAPAATGRRWPEHGPRGVKADKPELAQVSPDRSPVGGLISA